MSKKIRTRMLIILLVTLGGLALIFKPYKEAPDYKYTKWWDFKKNLSNNIHLGLDLKGGSHLVVQVQVDDAIKKRTQQNADVAKAKLQEKNLPFTDIKTEGINQVVITVPDSSKNGDIVKELENDYGQGWTV